MKSKQKHIVQWLESVSLQEMSIVVDAFYRVHRLSCLVINLDTLLTQIAEEAGRVVDAEAASVMLLDTEQQTLYFQVALGEKSVQEKLKQRVNLPISSGIAGAAARERASINVSDVKDDPRFFRDADQISLFETRSVLAVPMVEHQQLVGVLELINKRGGEHFSEFDVRIMEMFASLAATAVLNARLVQEKLLTERLAAIGEAVAGLGHCIRNIMNGIRVSRDSLDQAVSERNYDIIQDAWPIFSRSLDSIEAISANMLSYSREAAIVKAPCDLNKLVSDAVALMLPRANDARIAIEVSLAEDATIFVDKLQIQRVLWNLLANAIEACAPQGGMVSVSVLRQEQHIALTVSDSGSGIPPELMLRIFDPFFTTKSSSGTGLGLTCCRRIIEQHGGSIIAENLPTGGAKFIIVMPY